MGCLSLEAISIGGGVRTIEDLAFAGCRSLSSVKIPDSVTSIGRNAFGVCGLSSVTIGRNVGFIGDGAFQECYLQSIFFLGDAPQHGIDVFESMVPIGAEKFSVPISYLPETEGWSLLYADQPTIPWEIPEFTELANLESDSSGFSFSISGFPNADVVVEACGDLSAGNWEPIGTCTLVGGSGEFTDAEWGNYPERYYRVRME
jgi:hypothetical protein